MKKPFSIILITFTLLSQISAQDTLKICHLGYFPFHLFCSNGVSGNYAILNGDTIYDNEPFPLYHGNVDIYCADSVFNDGITDTTVYFMSAPHPQICVISSDSNNHPVIYVDSASLASLNSIHLKRETTPQTWQTVATFHPGDPLIIVDTAINTATQSYRYLLEAGDFGCTSSRHKTIHLQSSGNNLVWNEYEGTSLRGYYIHKRDNNGYFTVIDTITIIDTTLSVPAYTYTDLNFQNGDEYFVEAFKDDGCQSNSWQKRSSSLGVRSNTLQIGITRLNIPKQTLHRYYVDGSTLYVELQKIDNIHVYDLSGRKLIHQRTDRLTTQFEPGVYILHVGEKGYKVLIQ